jgi:hypothetical protein
MSPVPLRLHHIPDRPVMRVSDAERRWRLSRRHHLGRSASDPVEVVEAVAALHSSDPVTPYLSCWARIPDFETADLESRLYQERSLWRMHTIRRTLFVVPVADAPVFQAGGAREVAHKERARLAAWLGDEMSRPEFESWLDGLASQVLESLVGGESSTRELSETIPELARKITIGSGKWAATVPVSSRVLYLMAMEGLLVRTRPAGTWRSSQYQWARVDHWFDGEPEPVGEAEARALLIQRYLVTHGPVTMTDLRWWTGWPLKTVTEALGEIPVTTVELDTGETGFVPGSDEDFEPMLDPSVALLPALDSTTMGWKDRHWYLGGYGPDLFDTNGNAGPTVWVGGRVVGGWGQVGNGQVVVELLEQVDAEAGELIGEMARALTAWLDGVVVMPRFPSPMGRRLAG